MVRDDAFLDIVRELYVCFGRGDIAGLLALLHDDVDWMWIGPAAIPYAGSRRGHADVAAFFRIIDEAVAIERFELKLFVADDDAVVVSGDEEARVRATGRSFTTSWAHIWTLREGKVASLRCFADRATVAAAFAR